MGSGGLLPAEIGGRVCRFFCPSRYVARHRKPRRRVYALNLGATGIRPPDSFSYRSNFRSRSSSSYTTSGDIFYCSGSRQLNHSSFKICLCICIYSIYSIQRTTNYERQLSTSVDRRPAGESAFTVDCDGRLADRRSRSAVRQLVILWYGRHRFVDDATVWKARCR